ncbi:hypothetical protein [Aliarcobacter cryaerophilus]|jgi:hypothetical protein|uniref:hypothetical protein n=1 Tax=Aliarcobacter cryaerophilus TaxID=28198 RepID=UPI0021B5814C|nr:hypothetical protein [Aliarcobacter cryaerophilus]MCT7491882.1 hypothetical protein [Aliarcobacter cryaerophilus]
MGNLIPFILLILVWVFLYKYLVNKKSMKKWKSHLISFLVSFLVFAISIDVLVKNNIIQTKPIQEQEKQVEVEKEKAPIQEQKVQVEEDKTSILGGKIIKEDKDYPKVDSIPSKNMSDIVKSLKKNYNIIPTNIDGLEANENNFCIHDKFCEIYANGIQIQTIFKSSEALTNSKVSPKDYQQVCNAIMIGLTGANKELIEQQMPMYFNYASSNGSSTWESLGIQITIAPDTSNLLGCSFFKQ